MSGPSIERVVGIDFSGAKLAGRNTWVARCDVRGTRLKLTDIAPLESLAGSAERVPALAWLVDHIRTSDRTLFGIDFPFGLPIELGWSTWTEQLDAVLSWTDTVNAFGLECCRRAVAAVGKLHTRRVTDVETRTPFDCYHYRIVYQMFHGMRDLLAPLVADDSTAILPFQIDRLPRASRVVAEACPGSTLRRLGLPFNRYKQTGPGNFDRKKRAVRKTILDAMLAHIEVAPESQKQILLNRGGDALDAVIAAVGTWQAWSTAAAGPIWSHPRYRHEGYVYA